MAGLPSRAGQLLLVEDLLGLGASRILPSRRGGGRSPARRSSSSLLAGARGGPCRSGGRPSQARPELVGHDLNGLPGAAILSGPAPLLEPAHDHDPAAFG